MLLSTLGFEFTMESGFAMAVRWLVSLTSLYLFVTIIVLF